MSRNRNGRRCHHCFETFQAGRSYKQHHRHCVNHWTKARIALMKRARRWDVFFEELP